MVPAAQVGVQSFSQTSPAAVAVVAVQVCQTRSSAPIPASAQATVMDDGSTSRCCGGGDVQSARTPGPLGRDVVVVVGALVVDVVVLEVGAMVGAGIGVVVVA